MATRKEHKVDANIVKIEDSIKSADGITNRINGLRVARQDGWYNSMAGIGKKMDKSQQTYFGNFYFMDRNQLSRMYVGDGIGRRIIDVKANDMTREWFEIEMDDEEQKDLLEQKVKSLKTKQYFNEALKWKRLFGGSIIVIGGMDGQSLDMPMLLQKVKSIEWLKVVDQWDIDLPSSEWDRDPTSPTYGQIIRYMVSFRVSGTGRIDRLLVHNTRVIPFYGENIPKSLVMGDQRTRYWGASVLQAAWESLANFGGINQGLVNIIFEFVIGKYKFSNLDEMLEAGNEPALNDRMAFIQMSKSIINAVMLGADEDYIRESANVSGLPELVDRMMMMLCANTGYPITKIFGRSAAGMNSTGDGDLENYYAEVRSEQSTDLEAPVAKFYTMLAQTMQMDEIPFLKANPLRQMTAKEQMDIDEGQARQYLAYAQGDQIYLVNNVASPEEVALERDFITEDEFNLLRGDIEPDDMDAEKDKLKASPGEGSAVNPGTSAVEKNLLEKNTNKATSANNKKSEILKTGASATIPVNQPGSEVY